MVTRCGQLQFWVLLSAASLQEGSRLIALSCGRMETLALTASQGSPPCLLCPSMPYPCTGSQGHQPSPSLWPCVLRFKPLFLHSESHFMEKVPPASSVCTETSLFTFLWASVHISDSSWVQGTQFSSPCLPHTAVVQHLKGFSLRGAFSAAYTLHLGLCFQISYRLSFEALIRAAKCRKIVCLVIFSLLSMEHSPRFIYWQLKVNRGGPGKTGKYVVVQNLGIKKWGSILAVLYGYTMGKSFLLLNSLLRF